MNVAFRKPLTLAEFLDWERRQELRYEFDGFQPVAMTGGTIGHDHIVFGCAGFWTTGYGGAHAGRLARR
jgi:hypothetical protein